MTWRRCALGPALGLAVLAAPAVAAAADTSRIARADEHLLVLRDGRVDVTERLSFADGKTFQGADRIVDRRLGSGPPLRVSNVSVVDEIAHVRLREGAGDAPARREDCPPEERFTTTTDDTVRIVFCVPSRARRREVTLRYTLTNAVTRRPDGVLIAAVLWPAGWSVPVDRLTGLIEEERSVPTLRVEQAGAPTAELTALVDSGPRLASGRRGPGQDLQLALLANPGVLEPGAQVPRSTEPGARVLDRVAAGERLTRAPANHPRGRASTLIGVGAVVLAALSGGYVLRRRRSLVSDGGHHGTIYPGGPAGPGGGGDGGGGGGGGASW